MEKYKVLKTGNFYFPYLYIKDSFIVENIIDIEIKGKDAEHLNFVLKQKNILHLKAIADAIWGSMKKDLKKELKTYKNCWFVPTSIYKLGKEYRCSVDVLRKVK